MDDEKWWPIFHGVGMCSTLGDDGKRHRFWSLKSTSKAACIAYDKTKRQPMGFHRPTKPSNGR